MKYTVKKQTGKVVVTFKVTAEEWAAETEAAYQKNKNKYNIQGFRKGHAPRKVLEKCTARDCLWRMRSKTVCLNITRSFLTKYFRRACRQT